jgi:DNA-binding IclR family transcriptional regulator
LSTESAPGSARPRVSTVGKLRDLLVLFTPQSQTWGLTELSQELGWDMATTHRLANALVDIELLARLDGESSYQLGPLALELGSVYLSMRPRRKAVVGAMETLVRDTGLTTQIGILAGDAVSIVESRESDSPLRAAALLGERLPLHATAVGKAVLAELAEDSVTALLPAKLEKFTPHTITDRSALLEELAAIRQGGLARAESELSEGLCALAVGLPAGSYSADIASLTCAGPAPSIVPESWAKAESTLRELRGRYSSLAGAAAAAGEDS